MMRAMLYRLSAGLPCRLITTPDSAPYLERYYLGTLFGWRFYLHRFVGDDPDLGLHDHPWLLAFSIVLAGWYIEQRRHGYEVVRWFNLLTGDSFHRVILPNSRPVWTLFAHRTGRAKTWGFLDNDRFTPYAYQREGGRPDKWWLTAPTGREVRG